MYDHRARLHLCMLGDDDVHCCVMAWNLIYLIKVKLGSQAPMVL